MIINITRVLPFALAVLSAMAIVNQPVSPGISTVRISISALIILTAILFSIRHRRISPHIVSPIILGSIMAAYSMLQLLFIDATLWQVVNWLFLGLTSVLIGLLFSMLDDAGIDQFFNFIATLTLGITLLIVFDMLRDGIALQNGYSVRNHMTVNSEIGLNRLLNGMAGLGAMSIISITVFFRQKYNVRSFVLRASAFMSIFLLSIISGSRQNLIVLSLAAVTALILSYVKINKNLHHPQRKRLTFFFVPLFFSGVGAVAISHGVISLEWLDRRFIRFFFDGELTSGDIKRLSVYEHTFQLAFENGGVGVGPGMADEYFGMAAHSAIVQLLAESGLFGTVIFLSTLMVIAMTLPLRTLISLPATRILLGAFLCSSFLLFTNDLLRDPLLWVMIGLVFGASKKELDMARKTGQRVSPGA